MCVGGGGGGGGSGGLDPSPTSGSVHDSQQFSSALSPAYISNNMNPDQTAP